MTTPRDPDEILSAWLDDGPTRLPDQTRRAIAVSLPTTTQRRRGSLAPWRFDLMTQTTRVALGLVAVVAIVAGAAYLIRPASMPAVGSQASPSATAPAPSPSSAGVEGSATPTPVGSGLEDVPTILTVTATGTDCSAGPGQLDLWPIPPDSEAWVSVKNASTRPVFFQLDGADDAAEFEAFRSYMQAEHERAVRGQPLLGPAKFINLGASRLVAAGATDRFRAPTWIGVYGVACLPVDGNDVVDSYLVGPLKVAP